MKIKRTLEIELKYSPNYQGIKIYFYEGQFMGETFHFQGVSDNGVNMFKKLTGLDFKKTLTILKKEYLTSLQKELEYEEKEESKKKKNE